MYHSEKAPMEREEPKLNQDELESVLRELLSVSCNQGRFPDKEAYLAHMETIQIRQQKLNKKIYELLRPLLFEKPPTCNND